MRLLRDAFRDMADSAPAVRVPPDLYPKARRRRARRARAAVAAVLAIAALVVAGLIVRPEPARERFGDNDGGLPERLYDAPWTTGSLGADPVGRAAVIFSLGEDNPQSDHEDLSLAWWRDGTTVASSTIVARDRDAYRIVRNGYHTGAELSPDGRYLLSEGRVLDVTTGNEHSELKAVPPERNWSPDGETPPYNNTTLYGRWTEDGTRIVAAQDDRTVIRSFPSNGVEHVVRHPGQRPVDSDLALSPDGRTLAVQSNNLFRVYGADGTRLWSREVTSDDERIAGRAAWRADGRLFVFDRDVYGCELCGWRPGSWTLTALDGATGQPAPAVTYPRIDKAMYVDVVAWRGDVAYAVVNYAAVPFDDVVSVADSALVRLVPGASAPQVVLAGPEGTEYLGVATELLERTRPVGEPDFGYNIAEVWGTWFNRLFCPLLVVVVVVVLMALRRRVRR